MLTVELHPEENQTRCVFAGDMDIHSVMKLKALLATMPQSGVLLWDFPKACKIDSAAASQLATFIHAYNGTVSFGSHAVKIQQLIHLYTVRDVQLEGVQTTSANWIIRVGRSIYAAYENILHSVSIIGEYLHALMMFWRHPKSVNWREIPILMQRSGAEAVLIVLVTNILIGAIIGFQGVMQLRNFGADAFVPDMVALGHLRELGPIMTAIIVAGRSGAGFAAELGTMKVSEEVDALRIMGFNPIRWLVFPRIIALLCVLPLLTMMGNVAGIFGGAIASLPMMNIGLEAYWDKTLNAAKFSHLSLGIIKSFLFAISISILACSQGLAARGGAQAVGVRTTSAVVMAIFSVICIDAVVAVVATLVKF